MLHEVRQAFKDVGGFHVGFGEVCGMGDAGHEEGSGHTHVDAALDVGIEIVADDDAAFGIEVKGIAEGLEKEAFGLAGVGAAVIGKVGGEAEELAPTAGSELKLPPCDGEDAIGAADDHFSAAEKVV